MVSLGQFLQQNTVSWGLVLHHAWSLGARWGIIGPFHTTVLHSHATWSPFDVCEMSVESTWLCNPMKLTSSSILLRQSLRLKWKKTEPLRSVRLARFSKSQRSWRFWLSRINIAYLCVKHPTESIAGTAIYIHKSRNLKCHKASSEQMTELFE